MAVSKLNRFPVREPRRLAIVVSHPIQYYVPLYRRLAARRELTTKVFFTCHGGEEAHRDAGFEREIAWDIPLTDGYQSETLPNNAIAPGTHHFWGIWNLTLMKRLEEWRPDVVHITGYAFASHLYCMWRVSRWGTPLLFRGDSHLLDERCSGLRWRVKRTLLRQVYRWPSQFLYVGSANKEYYQKFGVAENRLTYCPHSVDISRFAEPEDELEREAAALRKELGLAGKRVLLFAGKFEKKKQPLQLMEAFIGLSAANLSLLMVGDGELGRPVRELAARHPTRISVLPFQNQSRMPVIYRIGDVFVLPSSHNETWGLAVNECLACGRPALVSDKVGGAADMIVPNVNGSIFRFDDWKGFQTELLRLLEVDWPKRRRSIKEDIAARYSLSASENGVMSAIESAIP